jgi:outer membrane protein W
MKNRRCNSVKLPKLFTLLIVALFSNSALLAQSYEWQIDKYNKTEQEKIQEFDSLMIHLKNNWQISLSYGQWFFLNSAKSNEENILDFIINMGAWNLSFSRYFSESISANINIGFHMKKIEPKPDYSSILNGDDIEIEGGGLTFIPLSVGVDYFFIKQKFRPFLGIGIGSVSAKSKFVEGAGNINDGINKEELEFSSKAPFVEVSTGFVYRTGENVQLGLNCDYVHSKGFNENIGGYKSFTGLKISAVFSIVF